MKLRLIFLGLVLAVAAGGGVVGWRQAARARSAVAARGTSESRRAVAQESAQKLALRLETAAQEAKTLRAQLAEISAARAKAVAEEALAAEKREHSLTVLLKDPEVLAASLASQRAAMATTYGALLLELGLTPEQTADFYGILSTSGERQADLRATQLAQGLKDSDPVVKEISKQIDRDCDTALHRLLGKSGLQRYEEYDHSAWLRDTVNGLAGAAVLDGVPWTPAQAGQMVELMMRHTPRDSTLHPYDLGRVDWLAVDQQAKAILSAEQLLLFQTAQPDGPRGVGGRQQARLNRLISEGDLADAKASPRR